MSASSRLRERKEEGGSGNLYSKEQDEVGGWKIAKGNIGKQGILAELTRPGGSDITKAGRR